MITIVMPTYKRNTFLEDEEHPVLNITKLDIVSELIILWHNINEEVPNNILDNLKKLDIYDKTRIILCDENTLNNRFSIYDYINTECVYSSDDDYKSTKKSLTLCYEEWLKNTDRLVGIVPRFINKNQYNGNSANSGINYEYNCLLTGGLMFHKKFMLDYMKDEYVKTYVNKNFNCEDIAFNIIHKKNMSLQPLYIHDDDVKTWKKSNTNISSRNNHTNNRITFFNDLVKRLGVKMISNKNKSMVK